MNWIKRNYDQFALGLLALILCAVSGYLIYLAINFPQTFAGIQAQVIHNNKVPPVDTAAIQAAATSVKKPATWDLTDTEGSLFVSIPYVVSPDGQTLIDPRTGPPLHPPVPNKWLIDNKLDILDGNILNEDPDGTGFSVLDDWKNVKGDGSDSVNPQDKTQHPPYWTKLHLLQYIKEPFRLKFDDYDGDVNKPNDIQFQINTLDFNQPTQFVKIGDTIAGTKPFKVIKFEYKTHVNPDTGTTDDVSQLTIQNTQNGDIVVLTKGVEGNDPDSYALLRYDWNNTQFKVKKAQEFAIPPECTATNNLRYKLIDIDDSKAVIQTPAGDNKDNGDKVTLPISQ